MSHQIRKRVNFEEECDVRQDNEAKRVCTVNTQPVMVRMEGHDNVCIPKIVPNTSKAPDQDFEDSEKKDLYEIKENFRLYSRRCWDDYWKMVLKLILNGRTPTTTFNEMYKELYRSICQIETEPPKATFIKDLAQILSIRSWFLLHPNKPEHQEEEVIICRFWLQNRSSIFIMEQKNDAGVNAEHILSKRLKLLKEQGNCHIVGIMELACSWSFCKRCIKQVAEEIKKVHIGVTKIIIKTRSASTTSSLFGVEVQPFNIDCWKEMRKYLTDEGNCYIGDDEPSLSLISEVLNTKTPNTFSSMVHCRVMPLKSWFLFNEQLRTCNVRNITCILCCVTFRSTSTPYCLHQTNEVKDVHAEAVTLMRLETMQAEAMNKDDSIRCIRIYSTYSPCSGCISKYSSFLEGMPELEELHLVFSSVYLSNDYDTNAILGTFEKKFRHKVKLEAFKDEYWEALKEHLNEEGAKDLENKSKSYETSRPYLSSWPQSPSTTPRKVSIRELPKDVIKTNCLK